jgi:hypothetical protein
MNMRRKWIAAGTAAIAAVAGATVMATSVFGGGSESRAGTAVVDVKMQSPAEPASLRAKKGKKPTMLYLQTPAQAVDVAQTTGFIDVRLSRCPGKSRVVEGGVLPDNTNVYEQGSYLEGTKTYHVLLGFDDTGPVVNFNFTAHLTCIKGVRA